MVIIPAKYKKKYKKVRKEFKYCLEIACGFNQTLAFTIIKTYMAYKHRKYIHDFQYFVGTENIELWHKWCKTNKAGKMLCGRDDIFNTLHNCNKALYEKFKGKIPIDLAMGTAYGIALKMISLKGE